MQKTDSLTQKARVLLSPGPSLENLVHMLKTAYWCEKQILIFLKRAEKCGTTCYLKASCRGHYDATKVQLTRLEHIFSLLGRKKRARVSYEMKFLMNAAKDAIRNTEKRSLERETTLITFLQEAERLEIRLYQSLIAITQDFALAEATALLQETLVEEQEAEETFVAIMEDTLNEELFATVKVDAYEEIEMHEAVIPALAVI